MGKREILGMVRLALAPFASSGRSGFAHHDIRKQYSANRDSTNKEGRFWVKRPSLLTFFFLFPWLDPQAALAALFLSAQRFFIISEMRLFAAALKRRRPRLPLPTTATPPRRPLREPRRAEIA